MSKQAHHHSFVATKNYNLAFALGIILKLVFIALELLYGKKTGSSALIADALHNISDVAGLLISWFGIFLGRFKTTKNFTFGFKKATIIASLLNAIILIVGVFYIFVESIDGFIHKKDIATTDVIIVALIGIVINGITAILFLSGSKDDLNIKSAFLHMLSDVLASAGVVISGVIIFYTGISVIDPIVGIIIGLMILLGTYNLLIESLKLIFLGVPSNINIAEVKKVVLQTEGVISMHDLHIWAISTTENAISMHIITSQTYSNSNLITLLKQKFNLHHFTIQIEGCKDLCQNEF